METMPVKHIIGIDGGGTGCRVAIADLDAHVVGQGEAGPANATTDMQATLANIGTALTTASQMAGLSETDISGSACHAGIAGVLTERQAAAIKDVLPTGANVTEDTVTTLRGGLGARDGILISLGTGTLIGRARKGRQEFIGGWGLMVSDQASGGWLGKSLLTEVLLCHDGLTPPTEISRSIMSRFDDDPRAIAAFAAAATPADFAEFAPQVTDAASSGDPIALSLVQSATTYLTEVIDNLGLARKEVLCLTGGLGPFYETWLMPNHRKRLARPEGTAIDGALSLARDMFDDQ